MNIPSQADDDIINVSSDNNDTLSSEVVLDGEQEVIDQGTNQASSQGLGERLRHNSREKRPPQRLTKEL